jgi:hypothetical protein
MAIPTTSERLGTVSLSRIDQLLSSPDALAEDSR